MKKPLQIPKSHVIVSIGNLSEYKVYHLMGG